MILKHETRYEFNNIINILSFFMFAWLNNGIARIIPGFNAYAFLVIYIIWIIIVLNYKKSFLIELMKETKWIVLLILSCLFSFVSMYNKLEGKVLEWIFIFIIYSIVLFFSEHPNYKFMKYIFIFILVDKILISIYTMFFLSMHPDLSRLLAGGFVNIEDIVTDSYMLAGYSYIYSSIALIIFLKIDYVNIQKKYHILLLVYLIAALILIYKASYAFALILLIAFIILSYFYIQNNKFKNLLLILFFLFLYSFFDEFINFVINLKFFTPQVQGRLLLISDFLAGKNMQGTDIVLRSELYLQSWNVFTDNLQNFFFGVFESGVASEIIGYHSEWLDDLALFGVLRFSFLVLFLRQSVKKMLTMIQNKDAFRYVLIYIVITGLINPILYLDLFLTVFVVFYFERTVLNSNLFYNYSNVTK